MTAAPPPAHDQQDADHSAGWIQPALDQQGALPRLLSALASRWWVTALAIAAALATAVAYLGTASRVYEAETDVLVTPVPNQTAVPGFGLIVDSSDPARATETIARLVTTPAVADRAATDLGLRASALAGSVAAKPVAQSNLVAITAQAGEPVAAARVADAFGRALIDQRTARLHSALDSAIRQNNARIAALGRGREDDAQRQLLLSRATDLRTLRDAPDPSLQLASDADVPAGPASPRPLLTVAAALIAGAILGVLGVLALEYVDPRLWREEQLGAAYRLPILARIPRQKSRRPGPLGPEALSARAAHGYRMLRANLPVSARRPPVDRRPQPPPTPSAGVLDAGRQPPNGTARRYGRVAPALGRCVMVTSALTGEGKTTTALNLAATLVGAGERVILIDADTGRPGVTDELSLPGGDTLTRMLWEHTPLVDALVPVRLATGTLYALRAETDAHDGLSDATAAKLLAEAAAFTDWVVVDLPPLTDSPDALPFARAAGDLLVAVRLRHTNLRALARLAELLTQQRLVPAGFVLTGTSRRSDTGHAAWATGAAPEPTHSRRAADASPAGRPLPQVPVVPG